MRVQLDVWSLSCWTGGSSSGALRLGRVLELKMGETGLDIHLLVRIEPSRRVLLLRRGRGVHVWWSLLIMRRDRLWRKLVGRLFLDLVDGCLFRVKGLLLPLLALLIQLTMLRREETLLLLLWTRHGR